MKRKQHSEEMRYIYRNKSDTGWIFKIGIPEEYRRLYNGDYQIVRYVYDKLGNEKESLDRIKGIKDEVLKNLKFIIPLDINDGYVRSHTTTGVVGVSYLWRNDEIVGFISKFRSLSKISFFFSSMSATTAWQQAVSLRYKREGRSDMEIPKMPNLQKAYKLSKG